jgi:phage terminase large subunit
MRDSVHKILVDQIAALGLGAVYYATETSIVGENGTEFLFKGLKRDISQIKSIEGIDVCWIEEAESVSKQSWRVLLPTIRKPGSEIWTTFNPRHTTDATYQRLVVKAPPRSIVRQVNFPDNPWFPEVLDQEQREMLVNDPEAWEHVWKGAPWARSDAAVLNQKWTVEEFTPGPEWEGPYYGSDFGFANDPTTIVKVWIFGSRLWIEADEGKPRLDNDDTARLYREVLDDERRVVRADSARPETINELRKRGLNVEGVEKWSGSVADGIAYLRSFAKIVIHPRCKRAQEEARLWRYKVDPKTDEVLPILVDGFDHVWDAVRYALAPLIKARPTVGILIGRPKNGTPRRRRGLSSLASAAPPVPGSAPPVPVHAQVIGAKKAPRTGRRFLDIKNSRSN